MVVELVGKDREVTRMQKAAKVQMITLTASENHAESPVPGCVWRPWAPPEGL